MTELLISTKLRAFPFTWKEKQVKQEQGNSDDDLREGIKRGQEFKVPKWNVLTKVEVCEEDWGSPAYLYIEL